MKVFTRRLWLYLRGGLGLSFHYKNVRVGWVGGDQMEPRVYVWGLNE